MIAAVLAPLTAVAVLAWIGAQIESRSLAGAGSPRVVARTLRALFKEEAVPRSASRGLWRAAPVVAFACAWLAAVCAPVLGDRLALESLPRTASAGPASLILAALFLVLSAGAGVIAGRAANAKDALISGLRAGARALAGGLALILGIAGLLCVYGTASTAELAAAQDGTMLFALPRWGIVLQPLGAALFAFGGMALARRRPFDGAEGGTDALGYAAEHGAADRLLFAGADRLAVTAFALLFATCYLGGDDVPWIEDRRLSHTVAARIAAAVLFALGAFASLLVLRATRGLEARGLVRPTAVAIPALFALAAVIAVGTEGAAASMVLAIAVLFAKAILVLWGLARLRMALPRWTEAQTFETVWIWILPLGLLNLAVAVAVRELVS